MLIINSQLLLMLYVGVFLWMILDIRPQELTPVQRWALPLGILGLGVVNEAIDLTMGFAAVQRVFLVTMQMPTLLLFLWASKRGLVKVLFAIFSAMIFCTPPVLLLNFLDPAIADSPWAARLCTAASYFVMLLLVQLIFRKGFNYLIRYEDSRALLPFFPIGLLYYIYLFALWTLDPASFRGPAGQLVRYLPGIQVFLHYFSLPNTYRALSQRRELAMAQTALSRELSAAEDRLALLDESQRQASIYRHDMRHHLTAISGYLSQGELREAEDYIRTISGDIETSAPRRFCDNHLVDLLCSSFAARAEQQDVRLTVEAGLPETLPLSDTELCAMLSNALENALNAAALQEDPALRWVRFRCRVQGGRLLVEVENPCPEHVPFRDGLPAANRPGHGHGCQSIRAIVRHCGGLCDFQAQGGRFLLRAAIPLPKA